MCVNPLNELRRLFSYLWVMLILLREGIVEAKSGKGEVAIVYENYVMDQI